MDKLLKKIQDNIPNNQPFFIDDIVDDSYSYDTIKTMLSNYVKEGKVKRYCQGIYYLPTQTIFGDSVITFDDVIAKKYIFSNGEYFGYYSGQTLLNQIGLSMQVPFVPEITSSKETTRKRIVNIHGRKVIVRSSNIDINSDNVSYLQFLDIFRYSYEEEIIENKSKIVDFFNNNNLDIQVLKKIEQQAPRNIKKLMEKTKIYDELASK